MSLLSSALASIGRAISNFFVSDAKPAANAILNANKPAIKERIDWALSRVTEQPGATDTVLKAKIIEGIRGLNLPRLIEDPLELTILMYDLSKVEGVGLVKLTNFASKLKTWVDGWRF